MSRNLLEIIAGLRKIKAMGWVESHRTGNTGIGKTLEDLLGIQENNLAVPDVGDFELKSIRKNGTSAVTLFTKSPEPSGINKELLFRAGYPSSRGNGRLELHATIRSTMWTPITKSDKKLRIHFCRSDGIVKIEEDPPCDTLSRCAHWKIETLERCARAKLSGLILVLADAKKDAAGKEFFLYDQAFIMYHFNIEKFFEALEQGYVLVDIRIGQYPDGRVHDHGTAFRARPQHLNQLFDTTEKIF